MQDGSRFWQHFEGQSASNELDAEHWIRVYTELQSTLERIVTTGTGDPARIESLMVVFEQRLSFWRKVQHDRPVRAARNGGRRPSGGGNRRSA